MICVKCGTEYEGSQCPKCSGPVITVNNSDYLARRKAYEEQQNKIKKRKADAQKEPAKKAKNYDEGVFDITKVDFNDVANKLKNSKDKFAQSAQDRIKSNASKEGKKDNKKNTRVRNIKKVSYKKTIVAVAAIMVVIAAIALIVSVVTRKNYQIYMSDGAKIYNVSSLDSKYVCDMSDAIFALDKVTFYTPEWPEEINKEEVRLKAASPKGKFYVTDVYDTSSNKYNLYIWSEDVCVKAIEDDYEHEVYYISDKGKVIYKETENLNEMGKTGTQILSMAEVKHSKLGSSDVVCDVTTIEKSLNTAYVYEDKETIVVLDENKRLYQYDYNKKTITDIDINVDSVYAAGEQEGTFAAGTQHLITSANEDAYIYSALSESYYVQLKNNKKVQLKGATGSNLTYMYDDKNDYMYWMSNNKIYYARFKDDELKNIALLENTGNTSNIVFLKDSGELIYINDSGQLVRVHKGEKKVLAENVRDGSLSLINNTDKSLTYIADGNQYYLKSPDSDAVLIYENNDIVNTSDTCMYKKRLYFYNAEKQLYSCNLKGKSLNNIGTVDGLWIGSVLK